MPAPYNYFQGPQTAIDPRNFLVGMEAGQGLLDARNAAMAQQQAQQSALIASQREAQYQQELANVYDAPGGANRAGLARVATMFPEKSKPLLEVFDRMAPVEKEERTGQLLRLSSSVNSGNHNVAIDEARRLAKAYANQNRTQDAEALERVARSIEEDPEGAGRMMDFQLASVIGPEYAKVATTIDTRQADVAKAEAEAAIKGTEAENAPAKARADLAYTQQQTQRLKDQTTYEAARLRLDARQLQETIAARLAALKQSQIELSEKQEILMTDAAVAASAKQLQADGMTPTIEAFQRADRDMFEQVTNTGLTASAAELSNRVRGAQGTMTAPRLKYAQLVDADIQARAKESGNKMTDTDYAEQRKLYPDPQGNPALVVDWMVKDQKLKRREAKIEDAKAEWLGKNAGLGPAREPFAVGDIVVQRGGRFQDVVQKLSQDTQPTGSKRSASGKSPGFATKYEGM